MLLEENTNLYLRFGSLSTRERCLWCLKTEQQAPECQDLKTSPSPCTPEKQHFENSHAH